MKSVPKAMRPNPTTPRGQRPGRQLVGGDEFFQDAYGRWYVSKGTTLARRDPKRVSKQAKRRERAAKRRAKP